MGRLVDVGLHFGDLVRSIYYIGLNNYQYHFEIELGVLELEGRYLREGLRHCKRLQQSQPEHYPDLPKSLIQDHTLNAILNPYMM